jgi:mannose-1-phosphate guanylyltransferase
MSASDIWAVVLAGGEGNRLRSLTVTPGGQTVPKQFCSLRGGASLLEETLWRAESVTQWRRMLTVVAAQRDPNATVIVLPSDHYVRSETVLARALQQAVQLARVDRQHLYLLGLVPEEINSELGYIVPGDHASFEPACVRRFVEKPSFEIARGLVQIGALWNVFILAASVTSLTGLYAERYPKLLEEMSRAVVRDASCPQDAPAANALYPSLPILDFPRDVLEGQESMLRVLAVPACGWSDLGTPRRVAETLRRIAGRSEAAHNSITSAHVSLATQHARQKYPS